MSAQRGGVIVLGSVNTDLVIRGPRLPAPGETVLGGQFYQAAGGKGANQAVAAARAGRGPVTFLAAVGDDALGRAALAGFARENLRCDYVKVVPGVATGVALILVDHLGQNCISVASGANLHFQSADVDRTNDDIWQTAAVFLACLESPLEAIAHGLARARAFKVRTILNPAPADSAIVRRELFELVDVLTPNEHEAAALSGVSVVDLDSAITAARRLQDFGCGTVIVTRGQHGSVVVPGLGDESGESRPWNCPALPVQAVDATAAGDAFSGALAVALAEQQSLRDAVRWATRAAALCVTRAGAQPSLPTRAEIEAD